MVRWIRHEIRDRRDRRVDLGRAGEADERARDRRLRDVEAQGRLHDIAVPRAAEEGEARGVARDQPASERIHRGHTEPVLRRRRERLGAEREVDRVVADRDSLEEPALEHGGVLPAVEMGRDHQMPDQPLLLRLQRRRDRPAAPTFVQVLRTEQTPDVEEVDRLHPEPREGSLEARPQFGAVGLRALRRHMERPAGHRPKRPPHDLLAAVFAVVRRRIEIVDPLRVRVAHQRRGSVEIGRIGKAHAAKADDRDVLAGSAVGFPPHGVALRCEDGPVRSGEATTRGGTAGPATAV